MDVVKKIEDFDFVETPQLPALVEEIFNDNYKVFEHNIEIRPGDVILDLGANEGVFSILMGKVFPGAVVYAYEPVPSTFEVLCENIKRNDAPNVHAFKFGVGAEEGACDMVVSRDYSGGSSSWCTFNPEDHKKEVGYLMTIDEIFEHHGIERCRLLKIDIEGAEYDALYACTRLKDVDYMTAEFHTNRKLDYRGRRMDGLANWVRNQTNLIHLDVCKMAD